MSSLAPPTRFRYTGADGLALVGGKVWTYAAGTSTPKDSYTDSTLGTANTNPVILDTRGEADIWLDGAYKFTVTDADDVLIDTVDNIRDLTNAASFASPTITGTPVITSANVSWTGTPTHSGNHTWDGTQTFNGNVVVGNANTDTLTIAPNAVTWSNNPTHSGAHTWSGTQTYSAAATFNSTQNLVGNTTLTTWAGTTSGSMKLSATGVPYGTSIHNNAGAVTGTTNQYICSGTYTPTVLDVANTAARSGSVCTWIRVGNVVTIGLNLQIDPTAADTTTQVSITMPPVMSGNFGSSNDASGCVQVRTDDTDANMPSVAYITASSGTQVLIMSFFTGTSVVNRAWSGVAVCLVA